MRQFNVDIFDRSLSYVCNGQTSISSIDDDYLSPKTNILSIPRVSAEIIAGYFIRLQSEDIEFFGLITDVSPGEFETTIQFASFISIFNEVILFWVGFQGLEAGHVNPLEGTIADHIKIYYVTTTDSLMRLPLNIYVDPNITEIKQWTLGITRTKEEINFTTLSIYADLIVPALK